ncbi:MAG: ChaN family lipoprotein [Deltaproteobacteria bacterium]|nr:ChaN family lipoprotein [Deltaproteobacteria bacterium]
MKNQRLIDETISIREPEFHRYERTYRNHLKKYQKISEIPELKKSLASARWIYMGDYHTNPQSQRALLRVLKLLIPQTTQVIICLEFLQQKHQEYIDNYLEYRIKEETFLAKINIKKYFHFDLWHNFKPIFEFARYHHLEICGIESAPMGSGLKRRDQAMAQNIVGVATENPGYKIFTFVGDLHMAPENLPRQVHHLLEVPPQPGEELLIYQNSDQIYWQLAEAHLEDKVELVKVDEQSFCLLNSSPILNQQSYLGWLDSELGDFEYQEPKNNFWELTKKILDFFKLKTQFNKLNHPEEIELFTFEDLGFLDHLQKEKIFSKKKLEFYKQRVKCGESFFITELKWVYLSSIVIHHIAEQSAYLIQETFIDPTMIKTEEDQFYEGVLSKALGFCISKIFNSKRKCLRLNDYQNLLEYLKQESSLRNHSINYELACLIIEVKALESDGELIKSFHDFHSQPELSYRLKQGLGFILGEKLYHAFMQAKLSRLEIKNLLKKTYLHRGTSAQTYLKLVKKYCQISLPQRL